MNYYIQGNEEKADQIKAAFEELGYKTIEYCFNANRTLYFTFGGAIKTATYEPYKSIIITHPDYKELELPVEPNFNVGDWVVNDYCAGKVIALTDDAYLLDSGQGIPFSCEHNAHIWSIEDAKDGDVLALNGKPFIYSSHKYGKNYCYIDEWGQLRVNFSLVFEGNYVCPATKQERDLLFSKMREVGYDWDADKKELHKIQPHYDISNFQPFDKVLVRDTKYGNWNVNLFSYYIDDIDARIVARFRCINSTWIQCIPFNEETKHLLGTTDMCDEQYVNW